MILSELALVAAALFAGAAIYVSLVEHPARSGLDPSAALVEWKPAYKRGAALQGPLALIGFALGISAWLPAGGAGWIVGALLMLANWPWTLIAILPTNRTLMATAPGDADAETRALLDRWARLHAVRTALGVAAVFAFLSAAMS